MQLCVEVCVCVCLIVYVGLNMVQAMVYGCSDFRRAGGHARPVLQQSMIMVGLDRTGESQKGDKVVQAVRPEHDVVALGHLQDRRVDVGQTESFHPVTLARVDWQTDLIPLL